MTGTPNRHHPTELRAAVLWSLALGLVLGIAVVPLLKSISRAIVGPDLLAPAAAMRVDPDLVACREEVLRYQEIKNLAAAYDARRAGR